MRTASKLILSPYAALYPPPANPLNPTSNFRGPMSAHTTGTISEPGYYARGWNDPPVLGGADAVGPRKRLSRSASSTSGPSAPESPGIRYTASDAPPTTHSSSSSLPTLAENPATSAPSDAQAAPSNELQAKIDAFLGQAASSKVQRKIVEDAEKKLATLSEAVSSRTLSPAAAASIGALFDSLIARAYEVAQEQLAKAVQAHGAEVSGWVIPLKKLIHALKSE
eukprot:m.65901 g.65901  ORF g.65901 m.65901 type:complete len:224 (-) comp7362_c0_seq1:211-882(-)